MSVLFETSLGDIIVDLDTTRCPTLSLNFLKLAKAYYYNLVSFHNVVSNFICQTGDPTDSGTGGHSVFHLLPATSAAYHRDPYFVPPEREVAPPHNKHVEKGTLSMALAEIGQNDNKDKGKDDRPRGCGSQFFFTLDANLEYLDGRHAPFGHVVEGFDTLDKIGEALCDQDGRPLRDIRIRHVIVLDDPFPDPEGLVVAPESPVPTAAQLASLRVGEDEDVSEEVDPDLAAQQRRDRDARAQALTLEMVGDLPFADVAPPENVLFVCKLNSVTTSEDLELIFSRFGEILSCEIIKDDKTGDSLQYAFVEFKDRDAAEQAYVKMDNVLVDDRRIHVDFSQSVSKLHNSWVYDRTGGRPPPNPSRRGGGSQGRGGGRGGSRSGGCGGGGGGRGGGRGGSRFDGRSGGGPLTNRDDLVFDLDDMGRVGDHVDGRGTTTTTPTSSTTKGREDHRDKLGNDGFPPRDRDRDR
ncbi:hypothetical protein JCM10212_001142, partial [Sporobolomyces blumeae]